MELFETIDTINNSLENMYGHDLSTRLPIFRVVWSNNQFEKRMMDVTDQGFQLLVPEMRLVPKYRQWIQDRYVLERLVLVPKMNSKELGGIKISYEPIFVFQNAYTDEYIPPRIDAAKFVIDSIYAAQGKRSMRKYIDDEETNPLEVREGRINKLMEELFGNETNTGDALAYKEGVTVPQNYDSPNSGEIK